LGREGSRNHILESAICRRKDNPTLDNRGKEKRNTGEGIDMFIDKGT
jgi:hypothetical protein